MAISAAAAADTSSASDPTASNLQFVAFTSTLDTAFWHILSKKKLEEYGLRDDPVPLSGFYSNGNAQGLPCLFHVDFTSFNKENASQRGRYPLRGQLMNTNTIDDFRNCKKKELIDVAGKRIWDSIMSGEALDQPQLLNSFIILTFANLKRYQYHYWFAFPALGPEPPVRAVKEPMSIGRCFSPSQMDDLISEYDTEIRPDCIPCFAVHKKKDSSIAVYKLNDKSLRDVEMDDLIFVFCDPSILPQYPGWTLRNYLCLISRHFVKQEATSVKLIGLRDRTVQGKRDITHSIYLDVLLSPLQPTSDMWSVVGWERNSQNKLSCKFVNLSKSMDPTHLAESAVDLNLKLMRWRLLPDLDLGSISRTKCLLLGAGTLGCNVARNLLGWGVRTITLVDNATVSYSNPVRQSLFTFEHCQGGGCPKAETAAESLKLIFPGVDAKGVLMSIPMPGHPVPPGSLESVELDVLRLEQLISDHDAVFLLMDSRESRWLPTVIGAAKNKIVLTAALGFDSWLAMRHGSYDESAVLDEAAGGGDAAASTTDANCSMTQVVPGTQLGCYYCNDVVAPRDSTKDRSLDQQCTVSRPGLSMMCSALIVELLASLLQHPLRGSAPAHIADEQPEQCILGILPHQIRGYLSQYQFILPVSKKFKNCTACSDTILTEYKKEGFKFLLQAFNDAKYLEEVSGLQELHVDPLGLEVLSDFEFDED